MRTGLLTALLLLPMLADASPKPFRAQYDVSYGNYKANATMSYSEQAQGRWQFNLLTHPEGMAAMLAGDRDQRSTLRWNGNQPETLDYHLSQKTAFKSSQSSVQVDAAASRITSVNKGRSYTLAYQPGVLDENSIVLAIINDLAAGKRGDLAYPVARKQATTTWHYRVDATVSISTALGSQRAIKVERIRDKADGPTTTLWFGVDQGFVPLRMEQHSTDGDNIDMRISHLGT